MAALDIHIVSCIFFNYTLKYQMKIINIISSLFFSNMSYRQSKKAL